MKRFLIGQKWMMTDAVFGTFFGVVIETFHQGQSGSVIITDEHDNVVDTFTGSAADFEASGEWQSTEE